MAVIDPRQVQEEVVERLLTAALNDQLDTVCELVTRPGAVSGDAPEVWAVLGDSARLGRLLDRDQAAATRKYGRRNWELLLYCSFSHCHKLGHDFSRGLQDCAMLLLAAGADPNAAYDAGAPWEGALLTALYGATGAGNHPALARLLLTAGASPNDDESLYHSAEHFYPECLELLLEFGANLSRKSPRWQNTPLYFLLCYRERDAQVATADLGCGWLLKHGADPNVLCGEEKETCLHLVARTNRHVRLARQLLDHGADPALVRGDGKTAYALAVRYGNTAVAELLRRYGAGDFELSAADRLLGACMIGDPEQAQRLRAAYPGLWESLTPADFAVLPEAAEEGRIAAVRTLLSLGADPAASGRFGATALHLAAFRGDSNTVAAILDYYPPLEVRDPEFKATPLSWCAWASINNPAPDSDYAETARLLVNAGASTEIPLIGTPEVQAVLGVGQP